MLSGKRLLLLGFIVVLLVVIPLTVYLVRQQQKLGAGAAPQTNISFSQPSVTKAVGDLVSEDINITTGSNQVSFIKLTINFDPAKLTPTALGAKCPAHPDYVICPNPAWFPNPPLQGPTVSGNNITITLSVGSNPSAQITAATPTTIATVNFKALEATTTPTQISFAPDPQTQVLSIASADQFNENVLAGNPPPANITITGTTSSSSGSSGTTNQIPVCTNLAIDRAATGTAPYAITFSATGTDSDGTISKVTFQFGDGNSTDVTTGGGIGTASINNVQASHQYNNAGSFTAKAILTDNQNGVSNGSCTQAITITAASVATGGPNSTNQTVTVGTGATATPSATPLATPIPTPTSTPIPTPQPTLAPTGPGDKIISVGALGIISSIIGAVILFAL